MDTWWAIVVLGLCGIAWIGQLVTVIHRPTAERLGLTEPSSEVDHVFHADGYGEAMWDMVILWILPLSAILSLLGSRWWIPSSLIGGGMYLYFAGRGITCRMVLKKKGVAIGTSSGVTTAFTFLVLWGVCAGITIGYAISHLG